MPSWIPEALGRRVIIGLDRQGRSAVLHDDVTQSRTVRPNGAVVAEIWRQEQVPARADDDGTRTGEMEQLAPAHGASIRMFTLPPDDMREKHVDVKDLASVFGKDNVSLATPGPILHRTDSVYVATVVSGRAELELEAGRAHLEQGDSFVLPGSMHAWSNPYSEPALIVCAVFPLSRE